EPHLSARGRMDAGNRLSERRLATAGFAYEAQDLAAAEREGHPVERLEPACAQAPGVADGKVTVEPDDVEDRDGPRHATASASGWWQRIRWPGPASERGGARMRQMSLARTQRGWKRQPDGGWKGLGTSPGMPRNAAFRVGRLSMR